MTQNVQQEAEQRKKKMAIENKFKVTRLSATSNTFATLEEAEVYAKQYTVSSNEPQVIWQAVSQTKLPVPEIEIVKF